MKKNLSLAIFVGLINFFVGCSKSDDSNSGGENIETPVTQKTFMSYALAKYDTNKNGQLDTNEIISVEEIDCSGQGITDLNGIEKFTEIHTLNASNNSITSYDFAHASLYNVDLSKNKLSQMIDFSKTATSTPLPFIKLNVENNPTLKCIKISSTQQSAVRLYVNNWKKDASAKYTTAAVCN